MPTPRKRAGSPPKAASPAAADEPAPAVAPAPAPPPATDQAAAREPVHTFRITRPDPIRAGGYVLTDRGWELDTDKEQ